MVMKYHYDRSYRGEHWPLVFLEGVCSRWASRILNGQDDAEQEIEALSELGIPPARVVKLHESMLLKRDAIREMASLFTKG